MTNDKLGVDMKGRDCSLCGGTISAQAQRIRGKGQSAQMEQWLRF
jgi:hypothetical protein